MAQTELWYGYLESAVFSEFMNTMQDNEDETISSAEYTTRSVSVSELSLPTVYLHELAGVEEGMTLTNVHVNAVLCNIQIDVYTSSKASCQKITAASIATMKSMRFNAVAMPLISHEGADIVHSVMRFRRRIGAGDDIASNL